MVVLISDRLYKEITAHVSPPGDKKETAHVTPPGDKKETANPVGAKA